jgi:glutamate 5-kinase
LISSLDEKSFDTDFINDIKSEVSFGGMTSKINAALDVSKFGIPTIIANGKTKSVLRDIFNLKDVGTAIVPSSIKLKSRKKWIGMGPRSSGRLFLDSGAANAIINNRKSLLPSGVLKIEGSFQKGQQVICVRESDNSPIARGLISYSSDEINQIKGRKSSEIEKILGYKYSDEIINRDNMVLI